MTVHVVMSVHVGEPVPVRHNCFWFKETHLMGLMPDHQSLFFISSVSQPILLTPSFIPLPCLTYHLSFSLYLGGSVSM